MSFFFIGSAFLFFFSLSYSFSWLFFRRVSSRSFAFVRSVAHLIHRRQTSKLNWLHARDRVWRDDRKIVKKIFLFLCTMTNEITSWAETSLCQPPYIRTIFVDRKIRFWSQISSFYVRGSNLIATRQAERSRQRDRSFHLSRKMPTFVQLWPPRQD